MAFGPFKVFTVTMASAGTLTPAVDLGRSWSIMYLEVGSMTSNTNINIHAAASLNGTYRRMKFPSVNTSSVQTNTFTILSAATNGWVQILPGPQYVKIETTATCDSGETFRIMCCD